MTYSIETRCRALLLYGTLKSCRLVASEVGCGKSIVSKWVQYANDMVFSKRKKKADPAIVYETEMKVIEAFVCKTPFTTLQQIQDHGFNPIENIFSLLKRSVKRAEVTITRDLFRVVSRAVSEIQADVLERCFRHAFWFDHYTEEYTDDRFVLLRQ